MIRKAESKDITAINNIRKQVHMIHVMYKPEVFKPDFSNELANSLQEFIGKKDKYGLVYVQDSQIYGYVLLSKVIKPETASRYKLTYLQIEELGVLENMRSRGIGSMLLKEVINFAKKISISDIRLNVWSFNEAAIKFYEKIGFKSFNNTLQIIL